MTRVVIVGAGPAGLAAAEHALRAGAEVTILDQSDAPGGQYHRGFSGTPHGFGELLGRCEWWPESTVWALEGGAAAARAGDTEAPALRLHVLRGPADGAGR